MLEHRGTNFKTPEPLTKISQLSSNLVPSEDTKLSFHTPSSSLQVADSTLVLNLTYFSKSYVVATSLKYLHISSDPE